MEREPVIEFRHVSMKFDSFVVHRDLTFRIYRGEIVTILGPSGSGKTVILKLIIGLLRPTSGDIIVFGQRINELSEDELQPIRRKIGMLFQGAALFDSLSVFENVAYSLRETKESNDQIEQAVRDKLAIVALPNAASKFPPQLSGGQKKRVALARALASSPEVVLFDEPTTGLDPTNTLRIDNLLVKLRDEFQITSVAVTHDIASAKRISDRLILINNGFIAAEGNTGEVIRENQALIDFISGNWKDEA